MPHSFDVSSFCCCFGLWACSRPIDFGEFSSMSGLTFRDTIRQMKQKVNAGEMRVGALWWRKTKAEFLNGEDANDSQLLVLGDGKRPSGPWYEAFKELLTHKPCRSAMRSLAQSCRSMSRTETIILMKAFMLQNAGSNVDTFHLCMDLMRCIIRLKLDTTFPDLIAIGFKKFDAVLVQARLCRCLRLGGDFW